jgi:hypothetical protein
MTDITLYVLLAGVAGTVAGLILQAIGRAAFLRFKGDDTKELSSTVGLRVSAIFGIAVGLIFASTAAHLMETKRDALEESRAVLTLYVLAANSPGLANSGSVRDDLKQYIKRSINELDASQVSEDSALATGRVLLKICRGMALNDQDSPEIHWTKSEFQRSCGKLIDIRGKKRITAKEKHISAPFWIFFGISFGFLAFLFGVFDPRPINIIFTSLFFFATGVTGMLIYAASDPYHDPGKISSAPLIKLLDRIDAIDKDR